MKTLYSVRWRKIGADWDTISVFSDGAAAFDFATRKQKDRSVSTVILESSPVETVYGVRWHVLNPRPGELIVEGQEYTDAADAFRLAAAQQRNPAVYCVTLEIRPGA